MYIIQILTKKKWLVQILCAEIEHIQWGMVEYIGLHNKQVIGTLKNSNLLWIKELIIWEISVLKHVYRIKQHIW